MPSVVSPLALKNGATLTITDIEGKSVEWPTLNCCHCGRVVVVRAKNPADKASPSELLSRLPKCLSCDRRTCQSPGCVVGCHPFQRDVEKAYRDELRQPWMLREGWKNEPVYRVNGLLIPQREAGFTDRELARMERHDG